MKLVWPVINLLQALFVGVWSVFWMGTAVIVRILLLNQNIPLIMARRCYAPALIRATGAKFKVEPLPDVDWSKPYIFAMNHQSMMDICCAFEAIPSNLRFVAKHTLAYVPFLGWYMWATGMIFINRSQRTEAVKSLQRAGERIRAGKSIIVYPEGTRSRGNFNIQPFKKGPFVLALEAKVPIVPVAIEGSGRVLPSDGFRIRPGPVRMKIGKPIETAHYGPDQRDELLRDVRNAIIALHLEIGGAGGDTEAIADAGVEGKRKAAEAPTDAVAARSRSR